MARRDLNPNASSIVAQVTGEAVKQSEEDLAAVALSRLGGFKGGKARVASLSKKARSEIANRPRRSGVRNKLRTLLVDRECMPLADNELPGRFGV